METKEIEFIKDNKISKGLMTRLEELINNNSIGKLHKKEKYKNISTRLYDCFSQNDNLANDS